MENGKPAQKLKNPIETNLKANVMEGIVNKIPVKSQRISESGKKIQRLKEILGTSLEVSAMEGIAKVIRNKSYLVPQVVLEELILFKTLLIKMMNGVKTRRVEIQM